MENLTEREKELIEIINRSGAINSVEFNKEDKEILDSLADRGLIGRADDLLKAVLAENFKTYLKERNDKKAIICSAISFFLGVLVACIVLA